MTKPIFVVLWSNSKPKKETTVNLGVTVFPRKICMANRDLLLVCYSNLHVERVVADNRYSTVTTRVDRRVMKFPATYEFLAIFHQNFEIFGYFRIFDYVLPKYRNF